ncbi:hypothetical protein CUN61_09160 [Pseudomonas arsenicoxydans]|uniref:Uncharacterized protein n=1 Tax=Pseudomonas arsenicoxydans TaxID=702115 RepID=A0A4P6FYP2_9PSED|nr:hypothetical protein CUN61_09160 [Pseudomonas arsenicoxydans]
MRAVVWLGTGGKPDGQDSLKLLSLIVPTLCVGMHPVTLCVTASEADAERPRRHSHAERGNDQR